MDLRKLLKMLQVATLHLDPAQAEKIVPCEKVEPHIQACVLNYTKLANTFNIDESLKDDLDDCECKKCFEYLKAEEVIESRHVVSVDTRGLKWVCLSELSRKGKKYQLPDNPQVMFDGLLEGLEEYIQMLMRSAADETV